MFKNFDSNRFPIIGIVTVLFNSDQYLPDFFDSLSKQTNNNFILYIIDNSGHDSGSILAKNLSDFHNIRAKITINRKNLGVATGNNEGIYQALSDGCDWIVLLNNDTRFSADFIKLISDKVNVDKLSVLVPKIYYESPKNYIWYAGGDFLKLRNHAVRHRGMDKLDDGSYDTDTLVDYAPTCAMIISSEVFKTVGFMDEEYFVYYDDTDFCYRLKKASIPIYYFPSATLIHKVGGSTGGGASLFTQCMVARNRNYFIKNIIDG